MVRTTMRTSYLFITIVVMLTVAFEFAAFRFRYDLGRQIQYSLFSSNQVLSQEEVEEKAEVEVEEMEVEEEAEMEEEQQNAPTLSLKESPILLLNRRIGSIKRICSHRDTSSHDPTSSCWLTPKSIFQSHAVYKPIPVKIRPWMSSTFLNSKLKIILYFSQRSSKGIISIMGTTSMSGTSPWHELEENKYSIQPLIQLKTQYSCSEFQPATIVVHDKTQRMYMYVLAHSCGGMQSKPTWILLQSNDGLKWIDHEDSPSIFTPLLTSTPTWMSSCTLEHPRLGYRYMIATNHSKQHIGSAVLYRSKSHLGPWESGPVLGHGLRSPNLHLLQRERYMMVFFTLIGDAPERILLGTIDTSSSSDWNHWKLLPGPILLEPRYAYENGKGLSLTLDQPFPVKWKIPSIQGGATGRNVELRHARFLPHYTVSSQDSSNVTGLLVYTAPGESAMAVAKLSLNFQHYLNTVKYRLRSNIDPMVINATNVKKSISPNRLTTLITGTGRSGTSYICKLLNKVGLAVSHDNMLDCGKYPGSDGVASWYDAFDLNTGQQYDTALQLVRYPLNVINSRAFRMKDKSNVLFMKTTVEQWEDTQDLRKDGRSILESNFRFSLKHWVRRNSFVQRYAEWRETIEDISSDPMVAWRMCMAAYFGPKCPSLPVWRSALRDVDPTTNTQGNSPKLTRHNVTAAISQYRWTWEDLSRLGKEESHYVSIARQMAYEYGYNSLGKKVVNFAALNNPGISYQCGFRYGKRPTHWNCWLSKK
jgi:hypothetical protein